MQWDPIGKLSRFEAKYYVSGFVLLIFLGNIYLTTCIYHLISFVGCGIKPRGKKLFGHSEPFQSILIYIPIHSDLIEYPQYLSSTRLKFKGKRLEVKVKRSIVEKTVQNGSYIPTHPHPFRVVLSHYEWANDFLPPRIKLCINGSSFQRAALEK